MRRARSFYLLTPVILIAAWAAVYFSWARNRSVENKLGLSHLPPAIVLWPEMRPTREDPELVEARNRNDALRERLIAIYADEAKEKLASMNRQGIARTPPNIMPNQSSNPTLSSGTSPAGQEPRHP